MTDLQTEHTVRDESIVEVQAYTTEDFIDLGGEEKRVRKVQHQISIPADPDLALALAKELQAYYVSEQDAGPPGEKPMHQRIAEAEPDQ